MRHPRRYMGPVVRHTERRSTRVGTRAEPLSRADGDRRPQPPKGAVRHGRGDRRRRREVHIQRVNDLLEQQRYLYVQQLYRMSCGSKEHLSLVQSSTYLAPYKQPKPKHHASTRLPVVLRPKIRHQLDYYVPIPLPLLRLRYVYRVTSEVLFGLCFPWCRGLRRLCGAIFGLLRVLCKVLEFSCGDGY